jgi:predicted negative regulator of RcsB-dependent stress response
MSNNFGEYLTGTIKEFFRRNMWPLIITAFLICILLIFGYYEIKDSQFYKNVIHASQTMHSKQ